MRLDAVRQLRAPAISSKVAGGVGDEVLVVDEADGFDGDRVAPDLAVEGHGVPGEVEDAVLDLGGSGSTGAIRPAGGPFAEAVMGPDEDVGAVAGGGGLLELVGHRLRMLDDDVDAELVGELVADRLQAVVALVAVDPDQELAFLEGASVSEVEASSSAAPRRRS